MAHIDVSVRYSTGVNLRSGDGYRLLKTLERDSAMILVSIRTSGLRGRSTKRVRAFFRSVCRYMSSTSYPLSDSARRNSDGQHEASCSDCSETCV